MARSEPQVPYRTATAATLRPLYLSLSLNPLILCKTPIDCYKSLQIVAKFGMIRSIASWLRLIGAVS
jgi:hypothetical protein